MLGADEVSVRHLLQSYLNCKISLKIRYSILYIVLVLLRITAVRISRQKEEKHIGIALENVLTQLVPVAVFELYFVKDLVYIINDIGISVEMHKVRQLCLHALGDEISRAAYELS